MSIAKQEFYFVRHGETEHNAKQIIHLSTDIPLNPKGRRQAETIRPLIETLPIQTICVSPLLRAQETKNIISANIKCPVVVIKELEECDGDTWLNMISEDHNSILKENVKRFFERTIEGINKSLSHAGPVLIVAHGGIHWAMCHHMDVEHQKLIDNCIPVHFNFLQKWHAKILAKNH